ncbi:hypothetical protein Cgig2_033653 [Carnegiea gigantea]|uniref:Uncharacterized protein n=1 Tax=Carnegiea gigantea TaxID=171969 RepID=A0A9Q1JG86_9CARY|nr:hypothetical protein Cgig2_033653 [Carnegiea gigantea]
MTNQTGKRKRMSKCTVRLMLTLEAQKPANPCEVEVDPMNVNFERDRQPRRASIHGFANADIDGNVGNNEAKAYMFAIATSKIKKKGERGKYKRINLRLKKGGCYLKMQAFVINTKQRLYRRWKTRLHYYYKSPKCGKTDEECIRNPPLDLPKVNGNIMLNALALQNLRWDLISKYRGHIGVRLPIILLLLIPLIKENNNVRPIADVIWLAEHTRESDGDKLKNVVANASESKTEDEILLEVLPHRSGYFHGKGTTIRHESRSSYLQLMVVNGGEICASSEFRLQLSDLKSNLYD